LGGIAATIATARRTDAKILILKINWYVESNVDCKIESKVA
jgi:hypothetical protein